jgi:hypothetical protein
MNNIFSRAGLFPILIFVLLIVGACGSKKTAATGFFAQNEEKELLTFDKSKIDSVTAEKTSVKETEVKHSGKDETERVIKIEFDTEKPLSNETNLPPVKSIEVRDKGQKIAENTAKTVDKTIETDKKYQTDNNKLIDEKSSTETEAKTSEKTERKESQMFKWIALTCACVAVILIVLTAKKGISIIDRIKGLFK